MKRLQTMNILERIIYRDRASKLIVLPFSYIYKCVCVLYIFP